MQVIGRAPELELVVDRLRARRLVTLVGPGGIGKTTLARAAAAACETSFGEGARFIDLTRIESPDAVRESIAAQLGYVSFGALLEAPGDHSVLLVVDNCEHVVDSAADALDQLLHACQMPTVLATSRMPLELPDEVIVPIGPLELPAAGTVDAPSVQLFVDRARDAGAVVDADEAVAELCRRLDGVPLAIELAASRTRAMSPTEILAHIGDGPDVLDRPRWRGARRHRSLRAAVKWSYDLLGNDDQRAFDALGVFPGAFTAELADTVAGATRATLDRLVAASMIVAERHDDVTWYRELDPLRSCAREHLDTRGERTAVEERFVDLVVERVVITVAAGAATWSPATMAELVGLYENIAAALRWSVQHDRVDAAHVLAAALWGIVHQAHTEEIGALAGQVLDRWPTAEHSLHADVVATAATCWYMQGDHRRAVAAAEAALGERGSAFASVTLRRTLGQATRASGDAVGALRWFAEAGDQARAVGVPALAVEADTARAQIMADLGDVEGALELVGTAATNAEAAASVVAVTWANVVRGSILLRADADVAADVLVDALSTSRRLGYAAGVEPALRCLAFADLLRDDVGGAARWVLELLDHLLGRGSTTELRLVFDAASAVLARAGRDEAAADLGTTALALPVVSITASVGHELFPPIATGRRLSVRDGILVTRTELGALTGAHRRHEGSTDERVGVFRRAGDHWEVGFSGETATLRGSKGADDLSVLLRAPGREVHCLELAGGAVDGHGTGPVIDATARRAYEERVRELQAELEQAEDDNDLGRAERARIDLDALVDQLTGALGLGGRTRDGAGPAERARQAVTQRVRSTIKRIEAIHPRLGRHLAASVRTGTFCSYEPEEPVRWQL